MKWKRLNNVLFKENQDKKKTVQNIFNLQLQLKSFLV
jgi:hypothetical protein